MKVSKTELKVGEWMPVLPILRSDDGRWEAAIFGRNLTAERYVNYAVDLSDFGFIEQNIGEPRSFGVEFKVAY